MKNTSIKIVVVLFFVFCNFLTNAQVDLTNGLVAWYPFNGNANDESPFGNHGTVNGASLIEDRFGNVDKAYSFDGGNDYIQLPSKYGGYSAFTACVWFKSTGQGDISDGWERIFSNFDGYTNQSFDFKYNYTSQFITSHIEFDYHDNSFAILSQANSTQINKWHFMCLTYENGVVKLFLDNLLVSTVNKSGTLNVSQFNARFGCREDRLQGFFKGVIDDMRIYNRALNETEIQALYTGTSCSDVTLTQPYWTAQTQTGDNVLMIDKDGNMIVYTTDLHLNTQPPASTNSFVVEDQDGNKICTFKPTEAYVKGFIVTNADYNTLNASSVSKNLIIENSAGERVARFDQTTGNIYLKGNYCVEDGLPKLTTSTISALSSNSVNTGGNITYDGGATVTERGVCWNTSPTPTTANPKTTDGTGTGTFTSSITSLLPNTTYYVRAYATNNTGTAYGDEVSFTTSN